MDGAAALRLYVFPRPRGAELLVEIGHQRIVRHFFQSAIAIAVDYFGCRAF
jgi:hypothetical protein